MDLSAPTDYCQRCGNDTAERGQHYCPSCIDELDRADDLAYMDECDRLPVVD